MNKQNIGKDKEKSGAFSVRMPGGLYQQFCKANEVTGVSANSRINLLVADFVKGFYATEPISAPTILDDIIKETEKIGVNLRCCDERQVRAYIRRVIRNDCISRHLDPGVIADLDEWPAVARLAEQMDEEIMEDLQGQELFFDYTGEVIDGDVRFIYCFSLPNQTIDDVEGVPMSRTDYNFLNEKIREAFYRHLLLDALNDFYEDGDKNEDYGEIIENDYSDEEWESLLKDDDDNE